MIFSGFYLPHAGGAIYDTHVLARGLVSKGYNVEVVTCNTERSPRTETVDGVRITRLPCWNLLKGQFPIPKPSIVLAKVFTRKVDLVSTQTRFFATSFLGLLIARWQGVPLVHTERGSMHSVVQSKIVDKVSRAYDHTIGSLIVKKSDVCAGLSVKVCAFLEHLGGTFPVRIPLGVHPAFTDRTRDGSTEGKALVYVGRLIHAKGVHDLLVAFEWVKSRVPDATLTIVGDGDYRAELEERAGSNVRFLGTLPQEKVADVLATADIFVHPSYSEGQPSAVAEASAIGLPMIATDVGGTRELVEEDVTGYLIPPKDVQTLVNRMLILLTDTDKAHRMGRAGREKMLREYPWQAMVDSYDKLFRGVIIRWTRG
jgi:glycosyltransferase involved in cell wall biosynthesis